MIIAIDFDGTIVQNRYPEIGQMLPNAGDVIREWQRQGHKIIINSCRAGTPFIEMVNYLDKSRIPYDAVNENLPERINEYGSDTRKISADIYIDDKCLFCSKINWEDIRYRVAQKTKTATKQSKLGETE